MKRYVYIIFAVLLCLCGSFPLVSHAANEAAEGVYSYPQKATIKVDSKYKVKRVRNLDACIYQYNKKTYILVEQHNEDGSITTGLMRCELQDAQIIEEGKPAVLVTVFVDEGFVKNTTKTFVQPTALDTTPTPNETETKGPSKTPSATNNVAPTTYVLATAATTPGHTKAPAVTPERTNPPQQPTTAPTMVPTPAPTQKPTAIPTAVPTPVQTPAPTQPPTEAPTAAPTPTTAPSGHWEVHFIVDVPEQGHGEYVCNVCGMQTANEGAFFAHQEAHILNDNASGWHSVWVVDAPAQGHYEQVWVPDP